MSGFRALARASLAVQISLASALFGLLIAGAAIVVGYTALSQQLDARSAAELRGKRALVVHIISEIPSAAEVPANMHRFNDLLIGHDHLHLALARLQPLRLLSGSSAIAAESFARFDPQQGRDVMAPWVAQDGTRLLALREEGATADGSPVVFFLSLNRRDDRGLLADFLKATLLGLPLLLVVVGSGAWVIARTGLAPMRRFHRLAAAVGMQSLSQRVSAAGLPAELAELAREFNGMLERIDAGYQRLQEFSGDLAHELRTPISTLLGRSQVALTKSRSTDEFREVLAGNIDELERLSRLTSDMLFIAQADNRGIALQVEPISLLREIQQVADYFSLVAEEKEVRFQISGDEQIAGDRLLIQRVITNLLSNAVKHSSPRSTICIALAGDGAHVTLSVTNAGEQIAIQHLHRIFDRFYRVDTARARLDGGAGLGLAIVRSITKAHGGHVLASGDPAQGTTTFTVQLPSLSAAAGRPE